MDDTIASRPMISTKLHTIVAELLVGVGSPVSHVGKGVPLPSGSAVGKGTGLKVGSSVSTSIACVGLGMDPRLVGLGVGTGVGGSVGGFPTRNATTWPIRFAK